MLGRKQRTRSHVSDEPVSSKRQKRVIQESNAPRDLKPVEAPAQETKKLKLNLEVAPRRSSRSRQTQAEVHQLRELSVVIKPIPEHSVGVVKKVEHNVEKPTFDNNLVTLVMADNNLVTPVMADNNLVTPVIAVKLDPGTEGNQEKDQVVSSVTVKHETTARVSRDTDDSQSQSDVDDSGMSAYEKRRLQNLRDNAAFLAQLGIFDVKRDLDALGGKDHTVKATSRGIKEPKVQKEALPRRSSLRLQRIDPTGNKLPDIPVIVEPERESRKPSGPLEMTKCLHTSTQADHAEECLKVLRGLAVERRTSTRISPELARFKKDLDKMTLTSKRVAKVTPGRTFSVAIHPSEDKVLVAGGGKFGRLGLWDVTSTEGHDGVFCYEPHTSPVKQLTFDPYHADRLYSCSYDGTVRCCHFQAGVFDEVYSCPEDDDVMMSSFDFVSPDTLLVGQGDGHVAQVDLRTKSTQAEHQYGLHPKHVCCISIHPTNRNHFATASRSGEVGIWDLRMMKAKKCPSLQIMPHHRLVEGAYFSPITGKYLLTISMDNEINIFDSTNLPGMVKRLTRMSHNNFTGRWLSKFRPVWHPSRDDVFVVGSMLRPRRIEMFSDKGTLVKEFMDEENLGSVCSLNAFHPTRNILVGGNSSGRLHVFM